MRRDAQNWTNGLQVPQPAKTHPQGINHGVHTNIFKTGELITAISYEFQVTTTTVSENYRRRLEPRESQVTAQLGATQDVVSEVAFTSPGRALTPAKPPI